MENTIFAKNILYGMKPIEMVDLTTQYAKIQHEIDRASKEVLCSGRYINGQPVQDFAAALSLYMDAGHVIPCGNGTDALQISLMALDLQPGDEVIVPAFTYVAAVEAIALLKLTPVLTDVNPQTFNIDIDKIEEAISPKTKAIIPVHLFGQTSDMEAIMRIAEKYGLFVIEDNAQSIGSVYTFSDKAEKRAGTIGDMGILSFFPTKNLSCYGDGGAVLTDNETLARKLRMIASHGQSTKYVHEMIGCNSRLDTLQAAILKVKLSHLSSYICARKKAARKYDEHFAALTGLIETPYCIPHSTHVFNQYTLKVKNNRRDELQRYLKEKNIPSMIYYPHPLHHQPAFKNRIRIGGDLSESEKLCRSVLSLPIHTEMDENQLLYIIFHLTNYVHEFS